MDTALIKVATLLTTSTSALRALRKFAFRIGSWTGSEIAAAPLGLAGRAMAEPFAVAGRGAHTLLAGRKIRSGPLAGTRYQPSGLAKEVTMGEYNAARAGGGKLGVGTMKNGKYYVTPTSLGGLAGIAKKHPFITAAAGVVAAHRAGVYSAPGAGVVDTLAMFPVDTVVGAGRGIAETAPLAHGVEKMLLDNDIISQLSATSPGALGSQARNTWGINTAAMQREALAAQARQQG